MRKYFLSAYPSMAFSLAIFFNSSAAVAQNTTMVTEALPGTGTAAVNAQTDVASDIIENLVEKGLIQDGLISKIKYWQTSNPIKVCFWSGTKKARRNIVRIAQQWEIPGTEIKFDFGDRSDPRSCGKDFSQIRVGFSGRGYWSYVGQDSVLNAKQQNEISLNLQGLSDSDITREFRSAVLHEFGHALGFHHEHKRCVGEIIPDAAYTYYWNTQGWDKSKTDLNVLKAVDYKSYISSEFDPKSIMIYPLPADILKDGRDSPCYKAHENFTLSTLDIKTAKAAYAEGREKNTDTNGAIGTLAKAASKLSNQEQKIIQERIKLLSSDALGQAEILGTPRAEFVDVDIFACNKGHATSSLLDFLIEATSHQPKIGRLRIRDTVYPGDLGTLDGIAIVADLDHPEVGDAKRLAANIGEYMRNDIKVIPNSGGTSRWYLSIIACRAE